MDVRHWTHRLGALAEETSVPGAVLGVWAEGEATIVPFGLLSTRTGVTTTADSVFQIGSVTKTFTATMVAQHVDEGRASYEAWAIPRSAGPAGGITATAGDLLTYARAGGRSRCTWPPKCSSYPGNRCRWSSASRGQYGPECVRVTGDETPDELTSLLGDYTDVLAPMAGSLVASQTRHPLDVRPTDPDHVFLARVDSPAGPLECAVERPGAAAGDLEGEALVFASGPPDGYPPWCVDQRGLVLVSSGDETSFSALMTMAPVVDGDLADYPAEISSRVP